MLLVVCSIVVSTILSTLIQMLIINTLMENDTPPWYTNTMASDFCLIMYTAIYLWHYQTILTDQISLFSN